jgi:hypothetical protein
MPHRRTRGYPPAVLRWLLALVAAAIVTVFAFLLVTGDYINEGSVVVSVSESHGVHEGDVFVVGGWAVAVLSQVGLLVATRSRGRR